MLTSHADLLDGVVDKYTDSTASPIHPEYLASLIDAHADDDAIFTIDAGMCNVWAARYLTPNGKRAELASFKHGTMANAVPQAIGAQAADRTRQVVTFSGDGGLSMLLGELLTVKLHNLPIKMVVFNNSSLAMVKLEMLVAGLETFGTDYEGVNYAKIAEAIGIRSVRVNDPTQLEQAITESFASEGPVLLDVVTDPNALSIPPEITWDMMSGFTRAATTTVLGGSVGKMVDLAKANLRHIGAAVDVETNRLN